MNNALTKCVVSWYRKLYRKIRKTVLKKRILSIPTIISNDCCGGVIYKNLELEFQSPTIKLYIDNNDFILLCNHIEYFLTGVLNECINDTHSYPVGQLTCDKGTITLYFMHYKSFEEAKECWERRIRRVKLDNIFFLFNPGPNISNNILELYANIRCKKVLLSSGVNCEKYGFAKNLKCYEKGFKGPLVKYRFKFGVKQYLDEYNWIEIFEKNIMEGN